MAMPVTDDCNPAIAGAVRRLRAASVSGSLQGYAQLAFDHGLDEAAHPITHHGFNRVEPIEPARVSATGGRSVPMTWSCGGRLPRSFEAVSRRWPHPWGSARTLHGLTP